MWQGSRFRKFDNCRLHDVGHDFVARTLVFAFDLLDHVCVLFIMTGVSGDSNAAMAVWGNRP